jgi:hypothetical protein
VENFPEVSAYFESQGLFVIPKVMRERFAGKIYPGAYTATEKSLIRGYLENSRQDYASVTKAMGETATIDMLADERLLNTPKIYQGRLCSSGHKFVRIEPNGAVIRCGSGTQLGNVLAQNIAFLDGPKPCDTFYCPYFCEKYTSAPFVPTQQSERDLGNFLATLKRWRDSQRPREERND